jgi:hypothetical protein
LEHFILPKYYELDKEKISSILSTAILDVSDKVIEIMLWQLFSKQPFLSLSRNFTDWRGHRQCNVPYLDIDEYEKDLMAGNQGRTFFSIPPPLLNNPRPKTSLAYNAEIPIRTLVSMMKYILHSLFTGKTKPFTVGGEWGPTQMWFVHRLFEIFKFANRRVQFDGCAITATIEGA